jgi:hypothetical protein
MAGSMGRPTGSLLTPSPPCCRAGGEHLRGRGATVGQGDETVDLADPPVGGAHLRPVAVAQKVGGEHAGAFGRAKRRPLGYPRVGYGLGMVALQVLGKECLGERPAGDEGGKVKVD